MAESRTIRVTPNVKACLRILKKVVGRLPAGPDRAKADEALKYLENTFAGKPQPGLGRACPHSLIVH
jgi:hypothetical protein